MARGKTALLIALGAIIAVPVYAKTLFHDDFSAAQLGKDWLTEYAQTAAGAGKPKWVLKGGVLSQTEPVPGDTTYAVIQGKGWPNEYGVMCRVRLDDWKDHDRSRAGVGLWIDPNDKYNGYTWLIHERLAATNMEFLNDQRAWFNGEATYPVEVGKWYWIKMYIDSKTVYGKIWDDGKAEPKEWLDSKPFGGFGGVRAPLPNAGLNGGAGTPGSGHSTASFDDVFVFDKDGPDPLAVDPKGRLAVSWGELKR
ncbi:hypothetical protein FJZ36_18190 [Candidatus Poribacteria bacterium]|nr:hypothetical protein [Candidatus Poribacteria bacterium]